MGHAGYGIFLKVFFKLAKSMKKKILIYDENLFILALHLFPLTFQHPGFPCALTSLATRQEYADQSSN